MTSGFGGGTEYPGLVLLGTTEEGSAVVHEVAHQWWYAIVGDDGYSSPWLDESFAPYANARFHGWDTLDCWSDVHWPDDDTALTGSTAYWSQRPRRTSWDGPLAASPGKSLAGVRRCPLRCCAWVPCDSPRATALSSAP